MVHPNEQKQIGAVRSTSLYSSWSTSMFFFCSVWDWCKYHLIYPFRIVTAIKKVSWKFWHFMLYFRHRIHSEVLVNISPIVSVFWEYRSTYQWRNHRLSPDFSSSLWQFPDIKWELAAAFLEFCKGKKSLPSPMTPFSKKSFIQMFIQTAFPDSFPAF